GRRLSRGVPPLRSRTSIARIVQRLGPSAIPGAYRGSMRKKIPRDRRLMRGRRDVKRGISRVHVVLDHWKGERRGRGARSAGSSRFRGEGGAVGQRARDAFTVVRCDGAKEHKQRCVWRGGHRLAPVALREGGQRGSLLPYLAAKGIIPFATRYSPRGSP